MEWYLWPIIIILGAFACLAIPIIIYDCTHLCTPLGFYRHGHRIRSFSISPRYGRFFLRISLLSQQTRRCGMNKSTVTWITAATVLAVIIFTVSISMVWGGNTVGRSAALAVLGVSIIGVISAVWGYCSRKMAGIPERDERIDKITMRAMSHSFQISIFFMIGLVWIFTFIRNMGAVLALSTSIFMMALLFLIFRWYFNREGDVS